MNATNEKDVMQGVKQLIFDNPEAKIRIQVREIEEKIEILRKEGIVVLGEASIREKIESIRRMEPSYVELTRED